MKKVFNKLVRDRIPEIIQAAGKQCTIETMDEADFHQALRAKLVEEAAVTDLIGLVTELANLYEVMDTLMAAYDIDRQAVLAEQKRRQIERGGFNRRIRLLWSGAH